MESEHVSKEFESMTDLSIEERRRGKWNCEEGN